MSLISRSELVLSLDSQARMTTDPNRPIRLGSGNGATTTWDTPFIEATTLKGYVDGALVTGTTLKRATGTDGVDQIQFPSAPTSGKIVAVSADGLAINVVVLDEVIAQAEKIVKASVQSAGYVWPVTGDALDTIQPLLVGLTKWRLRDRRDLDDRNDMPEWIRMQLTRIAKGEWRLPVGTPVVAPPSTTSDSLAYGSDESVFTEYGL